MKASLTASATYGATIPPIRAKQELKPTAPFLTTVGKSSPEIMYITANAAATLNLPNVDRAIAIPLRAEKEKTK